MDPNFPSYEGQLCDLREAARALDLQVQELRASTDAEIDLAFDTLARQRIAALTVVAGPFFDTRREKLVALAAHHALPRNSFEGQVDLCIRAGSQFLNLQVERARSLPQVA